MPVIGLLLWVDLGQAQAAMGKHYTLGRYDTLGVGDWVIIIDGAEMRYRKGAESAIEISSKYPRYADR